MSTRETVSVRTSSHLIRPLAAPPGQRHFSVWQFRSSPYARNEKRAWPGHKSLNPVQSSVSSPRFFSASFFRPLADQQRRPVAAFRDVRSRSTAPNISPLLFLLLLLLLRFLRRNFAVSVARTQRDVSSIFAFYRPARIQRGLSASIRIFPVSSVAVAILFSSQFVPDIWNFSLRKSPFAFVSIDSDEIPIKLDNFRESRVERQRGTNKFRLEPVLCCDTNYAAHVQALYSRNRVPRNLNSCPWIQCKLERVTIPTNVSRFGKFHLLLRYRASFTFFPLTFKIIAAVFTV